MNKSKNLVKSKNLINLSKFQNLDINIKATRFLTSETRVAFIKFS